MHIGLSLSSRKTVLRTFLGISSIGIFFGLMSVVFGHENGSNSPTIVDRRGRPDLCTTPDIIVLGTVEQRTSMRVETRLNPTVMTDVVVRVDRVLKDSVGIGPSLTLQVMGGKVDDLNIVSSDPRMLIGDVYLLFLQIYEDVPFPVFLGNYRIPEGTELPTEKLLRGVWLATCGAHPEGIYFGGPRVKIVAPEGRDIDKIEYFKSNSNFFGPAGL